MISTLTLPLLFTFLLWVALQANDIQAVVKTNPTIGFTLILQLTGVNGSHQFDKLTKTKTVETILTSMTQDGIQSYIEYLLKQVNDEHTSVFQSHTLIALFSSSSASSSSIIIIIFPRGPGLSAPVV